MFPEFGQNPLCLELDLDSYEGAWTHVAAFRGRGGWLMAARATIQSDRDLMRATLLAACDEHENPIPAWRAAHLTECEWSSLGECRELPPDLLDELLCEEEGAFFARWQRETRAELVTLHDRAEADLAALDARAAAVQHQADREIADLQRRRRLPDATPDHRTALAQLIAAIEADSDAALAEAADRRTVLRREIDAAEEALWEREDVLVEVEPLWCVCWQAASRSPSPTPRVRPPARRIGGGSAVAPIGTVMSSLITAPPERQKTPKVFPAAGRRAARAQDVQPPRADAALRAMKQQVPAAAMARSGVRQRREQVEGRRERTGSGRARAVSTAPPSAGPAPAPSPAPARPLPPGAGYALTQFRRDRDRALRVDEEAVAELARHREGTPQHTQRVIGIKRRRERIAQLDARIADLEARMAGEARVIE